MNLTLLKLKARLRLYWQGYCQCLKLNRWPIDL